MAGDSQKDTGEFYTITCNGSAITCHLCGLTSHNPNDVAARFCGHCRRFHDPDLRPVEEYDCRDCGRHIVQLVGLAAGVCGACQALPGWFNDPQLAAAIDPDCYRKPGQEHG